MNLDQEYAKIPLKCVHPKCLFEITECYSRLYWEWLQKHRLDCPRICPKYKNIK